MARFRDLRARRTSADLGDELVVEVMSLHDLVAARKTQRDKDWVMLRRLLEADFFGCVKPDAAHIRFWLLEMRTSSILLDMAKRFPSEAASVAGSRAAVDMALSGERGLVEQALRDEEAIERKLDFEYWARCVRSLKQCGMVCFQIAALSDVRYGAESGLFVFLITKPFAPRQQVL